MFERILVPIDASEESQLALPVACQLAEVAGARLRVLRLALDYEAGGDVVRPNGAALPRNTAAGGRAAGPRAEEVSLRVGCASDLSSAIADEARAFGADLIVLATHARGGFARLTHPIVAEAVLANTTVPLLLVNATCAQPEVGQAAPIVVAVDGTPEGAGALLFALGYARAAAADLLLLRIVPPRFDGDALAEPCYDPAALADAQNYLDQLVRRTGDSGVQVQGRALFGPVAETIATVAEQLNARAITLGTHSLHGATRLVQGSLADTLLRAESCPILLVRSDAAGEQRTSRASWGTLAAHHIGELATAQGEALQGGV